MGNSRVFGEDTRLPDLVRELGASSGMPLTREEAEKLEKRANRFSVSQTFLALETSLLQLFFIFQLNNAALTFEEIEKLYANLGIPEDQREKENVETREFRHEAVHITGFDINVQREDLHNYFKDFNPIACEWPDGRSANIIWSYEQSALKAIWNLSRPIAASDDDIMAENSYSQEEVKEKLIAKFEETAAGTPIDIKEFGFSAPILGGPWRVGKPSRLDNWKSSNAIFMRLARKTEGMWKKWNNFCV